MDLGGDGEVQERGREGVEPEGINEHSQVDESRWEDEW